MLCGREYRFGYVAEGRLNDVCISDGSGVFRDLVLHVEAVFSWNCVRNEQAFCRIFFLCLT